MDLSILANQASTAKVTSQSISSQSEGSSSVSESANSVNEQFDTFLNLLTAQIKNQDPLAPMDSTQFVEQLATFSNLELQAKNTAILEDIASMMALQLAATATPES
ncbi:MAG: flagellar hook assembly protein FlgD [Litorimonas sp.]